MKKTYLIAKIIHKINNGKRVSYFNPVSNEMYETYDDAKSALEVMDNDGDLIIYETCSVSLRKTSDK